MAIPEKKPYERLSDYLERALPGELEAGKSRGKATADIMFKFNEEPKRTLDDGIRRLRMGRGSAEVEFDPTNIAHYWYATEAKDAGTTIWTDTGTTGGLNLNFTGADPTDIVINSASGSYIEVTGGLDVSVPAVYNREEADLGAGNTFSLRMWLRPNQTRTDKVYQLLAYGKQSGGDRYIRLQQSQEGGNVNFVLGLINVGGTSASKIINLDQWYMMTITADATAGVLKWYLDNSLIHTTTYTNPFLGGGDKLVLFNTPDFVADISWFGDFKLLAGYPTILSLEDIQESYQYDLDNNF